MDGANLICQSIADQGIKQAYGVVGIPVIEVGQFFPDHGVRYIGMRNEQAASYAASAVGYMTGHPAVCLVVSGPGLVHALAGMANAQANCWPLIVIAGSADQGQLGTGAFQESHQIEFARPYCKMAMRIDSVNRIPFFVEKAVRASTYGRPGVVYLDLPGNLVNEQAIEPIIRPPRCNAPPRPFAEPDNINAAIKLLRSAERPLVIVGKGCAAAFAEGEVRAFIDATKLPFLATPMGKGVVPDDHPLSVGAARSQALKNADVVMLLGARLNWILHFGKAPRYHPNVKFIQADISPEDIGDNVPASVALVGHLQSTVGQLNASVRASPWSYPAQTPWRELLAKKIEANKVSTEVLLNDPGHPMSYYSAFKQIREHLPRDAVIIGEGANTMDIGRTLMPNFLARHRLDAGSYGTMGVGLGFAVAAAVTHPDKKVVAVEGDSAFGFSGMELEVACRQQLPITIIIVNNNGIYMGLDSLDGIPVENLPATSLTCNAHYERIAEAFGGKGYFVTTQEELGPALKSAMADKVPSVVNIMIDPQGQRKPQEFQWLSRQEASDEPPVAKL